MKHSTRKILAIRVALAVAVASTTLLAFGSTIGAHILSALASGISSVTDYYVPGSDPWGTAFDSSGRVWVALPGCDFAPSCHSSTPPGKLALFDSVAQGWVTVVSLPAGYGQPIFVAVDPNSNVWWSEGWVSAIGMLNVAAAQPGTNKGVTEYFYTPSCSSCGSHTSDIIADRQSLIWLDDSLQNTFGSFPIGGGSFSFYNSPSGGHSHDGLNVDSQNRIWYDEEFANKLAEAIQGSSIPTTTPTSSSPTSTPTSTNTPTPTPTTTASTTLGKDTFQRANQSKWGAASDGQTWGGDANSQGVFSISGNAGLISNTAAASYSAVLGPTASNAEVNASGSLSSFTNSNFGDVLRWTDGNN